MISPNLPAFLIKKIQSDLKEVADTNQIQDVISQINTLPDFNKIAIEFSLTKNAGIDVHFNVNQQDNLLRFNHQIERFQGSEWMPLQNFLQKWSKQKFQDINGLFFEFDFESNEGQDLPSFFAKITSKKDPSKCWEILQSSIEILQRQEVFQENEKLLKTLIFDMPNGQYIGFFGFMLSRKSNGLRINIHQAKIDWFLDFLKTYKVPVNEEIIRSEFEQLSLYCDHVILSIDVLGNQISPRIGMEAHIENQPYKDPRWRNLLNKIDAQTPLIANRKNKILNWNNTFFENNTPDLHPSLVLNSLSKPPEQFGILKQLTQHIKCVILGENKEYKAYLGFGQTWISTTNKTFEYSKKNIDSAIELGLNYILNKQQISGFWRDFLLPPGTSDQWVTAYIGYHLSRFQKIEFHEPLQRAAQQLLKTYKKDLGWGYSFLTPQDSDSSAWAFLFLEQMGISFPEKDAVLSKYLDPQGGAKTYIDEHGVRENANLGPEFTLSGWTGSHACVSAVVARNGIEKAISFIRSSLEQGSFESYWWTSNHYAICMALETYLLHDQDLAVFDHTKKQIQKAILEKNYPTQAFYKALLLRIALLLKIEHLDDLVQSLLAEQTNEDFWKGDCELRVPMPHVEKVGHQKDYFVVNDQHHLFTTTTVVYTLKLAKDAGY